jgi:hypothetical protein
MPALFRSDAQRNEVCATLCAWTGYSALWSGWPGVGPSDRAQLFLSPGGPQSGAEQSVARIAVALWDGRGELRFGDLLGELTLEDRRAVDDLLEALLESPEAVDRWIEEHGREGVDPESQAHLRARELRHTGVL